jgi:choice-of-anchor A domain-containing protein
VKSQSTIYGFVFLAFTACGAPELTGSEVREGQVQALAANDTTPPESSLFIEQTPDANGEFHGNVSILINATDDSAGVESISWSLSGAQTGSGTANGGSVYVPVITTMGTTTLTYSAKDRASNIEPAKTYSIVISPYMGNCRDVELNDFNLFVTGNYTGGHDVRGKVAAGGNISMDHFSVAAEIPSDNLENALVAGGNLNISNGGVFGDAHYTGSTTANGTVTFYRGALSRANAIDFQGRADDLARLSWDLSSLQRNGQTQFQSWGGLFLQGSDARVNVFWVDASQLSATRYFSLNIPGGSVAVINVFGDNPTIANFSNSYSGADARSVLFHFPDALTITAYNYGFFGTVLAPYADFNFSNGSFDGGIYAGSMTGNAEGHIAPLRPFTICGGGVGT